MRIWRVPLLLLVAAIAFLAIAGGALLLQSSDEAEARLSPATPCPAARWALQAMRLSSLLTRREHL